MPVEEFALLLPTETLGTAVVIEASGGPAPREAVPIEVFPPRDILMAESTLPGLCSLIQAQA